MRTDIMHSEMTIAAAARVEDILRATARTHGTERANGRKCRTRLYAVTIGRMLIWMGTRLQAMAGQPA